MEKKDIAYLSLRVRMIEFKKVKKMCWASRVDYGVSFRLTGER